MLKLGFAMTGSFCTFDKVFPIMEKLSAEYEVTPIFSGISAEVECRFGCGEEFLQRAEMICRRPALRELSEVEPIGPKKLLDILLIAPCTGNTLAKIANGITDTAVTMAYKSHMRNGRPVVLAVSTNDGLGTAAGNIATLLNKKNVYFVPFGQDDPTEKPNSLIADFTQIGATASLALQGKQLQPLLLREFRSAH